MKRERGRGLGPEDWEQQGDRLSYNPTPKKTVTSAYCFPTPTQGRHPSSSSEREFCPAPPGKPVGGSIKTPANRSSQRKCFPSPTNRPQGRGLGGGTSKGTLRLKVLKPGCLLMPDGVKLLPIQGCQRK